MPAETQHAELGALCFLELPERLSSAALLASAQIQRQEFERVIRIGERRDLEPT
jgi:hypothetical protein